MSYKFINSFVNYLRKTAFGRAETHIKGIERSHLRAYHTYRSRHEESLGVAILGDS